MLFSDFFLKQITFCESFDCSGQAKQTTADSLVILMAATCGMLLTERADTREWQGLEASV